MGYFISTVNAGMTREITKWRKAAKGVRKNIKRAKKSNPTRAAQVQVNREHARRHLRWTVNDNFTAGDYWLTFTYAREYAPTDESAVEEYKKLLRRLRALYRKAGAVLKYIAVCGEPGHRPHIHILCNKGVSAEAIQSLWSFGRVTFKLLDASGQYRALAEYIFKHSDCDERKGKRYNTSKNLTHPEPTEKETNAKTWREEPTAPKGFMIDKTSPIERGVDAVTGAEYMRYTLIKTPPSGQNGRA